MTKLVSVFAVSILTYYYFDYRLGDSGFNGEGTLIRGLEASGLVLTSKDVGDILR